ncbi:MAG TPA: helix-turn-helix domain-containing protein [Actinomycetota bacterium]
MGTRRGIERIPLLTVREVAHALRVSTMTVYRLIHGGRLRALRVGKSYRVRESDLDTYLSGRTVKVEGRTTEEA